VYNWLFQLFGEALGKALPPLIEQAFDMSRVLRSEEKRAHVICNRVLSPSRMSLLTRNLDKKK